MQLVLLCIDPAAERIEQDFFITQFHGRHWEPFLVSVDTLAEIELPPVAAAVAYAADWPDENLAERLQTIRSAIGDHKQLLAILPRPPDSYPEATRSIWTRAFGYGFRLSEAIDTIDDFIAGRA